MKYAKLILLGFMCFLMSGCFYFTASVMIIGVEQEELWEKKGGKVLMANNGDLAIEIEAINHTVRYNDVKHVKKYKTITKDKLVAAAEEQKNRRVSKRLTKDDQEYGYTFTLWVDGFKQVPPPFSNDQSAIAQVETVYSIPYSNVERNENHSDTIYLDYDGDRYKLNNDPRRNIHGYEYERTRWWGYPSRVILIAPAVALDIATFPIQFIIIASTFHVE